MCVTFSVLFPLLQVGVVINPVLADAGDPQNITARLVSIQVRKCGFEVAKES